MLKMLGMEGAFSPKKGVVRKPTADILNVFSLPSDSRNKIHFH
jgi:hypothetical protein